MSTTHTIKAKNIALSNAWHTITSATTVDGLRHKRIEVGFGRKEWRVRVSVGSTDQYDIEYQGASIKVAVKAYNEAG